MKKMKQVLKTSALSLAVMVLMALSMSVTAYADAPSNLRQTNDTTTSARVEFTGVSGNVSYYGYQISTNANFTGKDKIENYTSASQSYISIPNLSAGTSYYVRIGYGTTKQNCYNNWSEPLEVVTRPASMTEIQFTDATNKTATISWTPVAGANSYAVSYNDVTKYTSETSYTLTYATGKVCAWVAPCRKSSSGYVAEGSKKCSSYDITAVTKKIAKSKFGFRNAWTSLNSFQIAADYDGHGMTAAVYDVKTNKKKFSGTAKNNSYSHVDFEKKFKLNNMYKYRVRAYANTTAGKKINGGWSDYRYFINPEKPSVLVSGKKIKLNWKKLTGVSKIKVQVSTKEKSGYKTCATLDGKKTSYTITKCGKSALKSNTVYYYKLIYYAKSGKKLYKSDVNWSGKAQVR